MQAEWKKMCDCLKTDLPTTFRVNENSNFYPLIDERLHSYAKQVERDNLQFEDKAVTFAPLSWYPPSLPLHEQHAQQIQRAQLQHAQQPHPHAHKTTQQGPPLRGI